MRTLFSLILLLLLTAGIACSQQQQPAGFIDLTAAEFKQATDTANGFILDFRTPAEYIAGHIAASVLMNYNDAGFADELNKLDKNQTYYVYCRSGNRSSQAIKLMSDMGFTNVYHLQGGILAWQRMNFEVKK